MLEKMSLDVLQLAQEKLFSFWIPLLMALEDRLDKMMIVVTPLNLLGKQNIQHLMLENTGLSAVVISRDNANPETFKVM